MKSWADHCSSDEEDAVANHHGAKDDVTVADEAEKLNNDQPHDGQIMPISPDEIVPDDHKPTVEREYDFPSDPPFTAFVGNLSYQINDVAQLVEAVSELTKERLQEPVNILGGRIAWYRDDPTKHRGFGYVEVETLDQLKLLMTLNDGQSMIAGRKVQMDTANHHHNNRRGPQGNRGSSQRDNKGSFSNSNPPNSTEVDGSKFRGGRYNNNRNRGDGENHGNRRKGSNRSSFDQNNDRHQQSEATGGPPVQRPSLKLAPRSKPVDSEPTMSSASSIFGGATARDEKAWHGHRVSMQKEQNAAKKTPEPKEETAVSMENVESQEGAKNVHVDGSAKRPQQQSQEQPQNGRGRGVRGRGGRGSGGGRHDKGDLNQQNRRGPRRNQTQQQEKKQNKHQNPEEKAAAAVARVSTAALVQQTVPKKTEASNKFALLMDSDSE